MLLIDDNAKELLDKNNIPYWQYETPSDIYLTAIMNMALDTAIRYNDGNSEDEETIKKYVAYLKKVEANKRCFNRLEKASHDILNIICELTEDKHEEIMKEELDG